MNRLHAIIRRFHCIGTHQRFAIDAIPMIQTEPGQRLAGWLLYHYPSYLRGAIDPDLRFRDYHNHLLDVRHGYWGGAPRVAHQWYGRLQKYIRAERFSDAAHAAGVLSHYVTDVIQPLHTISNDREALIHRPLEWSIDQSYDRIYRRYCEEQLRVEIQLSNRPEWLGSMMMHAAQYANHRSELLVSHYRFKEGVENPGDGLDDQSIGYLAELFGLAITAICQVLQRAAAESESFIGYPIPQCGSGAAVVSATLTSPLALCRRFLRQRQEMSAIRALSQEYLQTGSLSKCLPAEVDIKRRVLAIRDAERRRQDQSGKQQRDQRRIAA